MAAITNPTTTIIKNMRLLWLLRLAWLLLFGFGLLLFILASVRDFSLLDAQAINPEIANFLSSLNLAPNFAQLYFRLLGFLANLLVSLLAIFIFWRRSDDWIALSLSIVIFYLSLANSATIASYFPSQVLFFAMIAYPLGLLLGFVFPTGQMVPAFARWFIPFMILALLFVLPQVFGDFGDDLRAQNSPYIIFDSTGLLAQSLLFIIFISAGIAQIYRYLRVSTALQRQQCKWFLYGNAIFFIIDLADFLLPFLVHQLAWPAFYPEIGTYQLSSFLWMLIMSGLVILSFCLVPLTLAFSILRYRLWDIDIVINRSLVGFFVTVLLLLIFVPSVFLIQSLLGAENTLFSFVISAVLPAVLFNPVRKRARQFVDQRIYGLKFDLNQLKAAQNKPAIRNVGALTGKRLGQYEVLDFIGKGGMGEVYKGYHEGQTVALKSLPQQFSQDSDFLRRFQREAEVMQKLEHPKIVRLLGAGESEGLRYLALEFIEGKELRNYLQEKGKLELADAYAILCDIAAALDYLHNQNIVHRDIKPSNVMLRGDDPQEAILMDFGIAKIEDGKTRLTGSGAIGTIDYMSPEQIMAAKEVDKRADVYALGVIAYEMLTGERPFKGSAAQVMFAHLQQPVIEPRQHNPNLSETVSSAILKALEKQAENRFESAGAFAAALAF